MKINNVSGARSEMCFRHNSFEPKSLSARCIPRWWVFRRESSSHGDCERRPRSAKVYVEEEPRGTAFTWKLFLTGTVHKGRYCHKHASRTLGGKVLNVRIRFLTANNVIFQTEINGTSNWWLRR